MPEQQQGRAIGPVQVIQNEQDGGVLETELSNPTTASNSR